MGYTQLAIVYGAPLRIPVVTFSQDNVTGTLTFQPLLLRLQKKAPIVVAHRHHLDDILTLYNDARMPIFF